ncbi:MAG: hypothetical protein IKB08_05915 [Clostridia bacterium]|nr:hypothetical protein [Clostridia bacterium]
MSKEPLYILTYDHGGYVLWEKEVKPRLKNIKEWMKKYPKLRIGLDYESFTFDEFSRQDPEVVRLIGELLKEYPDRVGLGATTYGQPLSLYISEESNIRQLSLAVKTNLKYFGITPDVYCISEFALNNQTPQMIKLCGYKGAVLRSHVMGYGYTKTFDKAFGLWVGKDKTGVPAIPVYDGQGRGYNCTTLDNWILSRWPRDTDISLEDFRERFKKYSPLLASRYDDLTQPIEEVTAEIEKHDDYKYVLLEDLPALYGEPTDILDTDDNDFHSQMPWGYCGNEIFSGCRKGEIEAVQAEKLNSLSVLLGGEAFREENEEAWKYILAAQHHDVTICGLLDLARRFIPASLSQSLSVKKKSLENINKCFSYGDFQSVFLYNPHSFAVDTVVEIPVKEAYSVENTESELVTDENGRKSLLIRASLPALTAKSLKLIKEEKSEEKYFTYDKEKGCLSTPFYDVEFDSCGLKKLLSKNGKALINNENSSLLQGFINGSYRKNEGSAQVTIRSLTAELVFKGKIDTIPFSFTMRFSRHSPLIDCKVSCTVKESDRIGRTDITEGRPVPLTLNGHHHDDKLCFTMKLGLSENRKMYRDLPFSIAKWDGQLRLTEEYWYENDLILHDTKVSPEQSFRNKTHLQGVYWIALSDSDSYIAVINKGCMGSTVEGNRVYIPLIYSNDYMCGTKIIDGTFVNEFALLPEDREIKLTDVHKTAMAYNYAPVTEILEKGNGEISGYSLASFESDGDGVILTALTPEEGYLTARFCNFSDSPESVVFTPRRGKITAETDLLGNELSPVTTEKLTFRPWEIKTVKITLD